MIRRIDTTRIEPLLGVAATRELERQLLATLPAFGAMERAGKAVSRLALALVPHARCIWVACGPGNNGGDGLVAATHLLRQARRFHTGLRVAVTFCGQAERLPPDASRAWTQAIEAGIEPCDTPPPAYDLAIDALLGLGADRAPADRIAEMLTHMHNHCAPVLSLDLPSGLLADSGRYLGPAPRDALGPRHTLSLLGLQPGLFTADGRDLAGSIWMDDLGASTLVPPRPAALLHPEATVAPSRSQASHKGSHGDVVVIGGQDIDTSGEGMTGAAVLAARAALHSGAGRVYLGLLSEGAATTRWDPVCPELMFRRVSALVQDTDLMSRAAVVCGCGGGAAVTEWLPVLLSTCPALVLDADALNALARDRSLRSLGQERARRGWITVITPHPLEAARLLCTDTASVMSDRLGAARALADELDAICVLKGSGTVTAAPGQVSRINASGNPALATAGTGDVLAGMLGTAVAGLTAKSGDSFLAVADAVARHGAVADRWPTGQRGELSASRLAQYLERLR
jgi:hydroxyethylthiazole kinase-like uncharacterized protein yjeF